jgi:hydrogenase-4 component F
MSLALPSPALEAWILVAASLGAGFLATITGEKGRPAASALLLLGALLAFVSPLGAGFAWLYPPLVLVEGALAFSLPFPRAPRAPILPTPLYPLLLGAFVATLLLLILPGAPMLRWAAVEATTAVSVPLVAFGASADARGAAWRYLILAGTGGLLALLGILLMGATARSLIAAGTVLVLVGFAAKAGLVPFHEWLPTAHAEAPPAVSLLLSGAELGGVLYVLFGILGLGEAALGHPLWPRLTLLLLGVLSLAVAPAMMALEGHLKRLLAFSSIEHMGLVAAAGAMGGTALIGALLHIVTHGLAKALAFRLSADVEAEYHTLALARIRSLSTRLPWVGTGFLVALTGLAGMPPLGLFFTEWQILRGVITRPDGPAVGLVLAVALAVGAFVLAARTPQLWYQEERRAISSRRFAARIATLGMSLLLLAAGALALVPTGHGARSMALLVRPLAHGSLPAWRE